MESKWMELCGVWVQRDMVVAFRAPDWDKYDESYWLEIYISVGDSVESIHVRSKSKEEIDKSYTTLVQQVTQ